MKCNLIIQIIKLWIIKIANQIKKIYHPIQIIVGIYLVKRKKLQKFKIMRY
jgi:hypothetical protein